MWTIFARELEGDSKAENQVVSTARSGIDRDDITVSLMGTSPVISGINFNELNL